MRPEEFEELIYRVEDGVARLQLNRPGAGNSFSSRLYGELKWGIRNADFDDDVDVVVITPASAVPSRPGETSRR